MKLEIYKTVFKGNNIILNGVNLMDFLIILTSFVFNIKFLKLVLYDFEKVINHKGKFLMYDLVISDFFNSVIH